MSWVNIWKDEEAASFVASYRDGNETVPTAVTGSGTMVEAVPNAIKEHLAGNGQTSG